MQLLLLPTVLVFILVFQIQPSNGNAFARFNPSLTHYGKHFVLGFTAQVSHQLHKGYNEISILALFDTYVNISLHTSKSPLLKAKYIKAGHVLKYIIPALMRMHSTMKDTKGILVTATEDVAVFCLNKGILTSDGYLALPTNVLGTKYIVASYPVYRAKANLAFISPQGNTSVRITLNARGILPYEGRSYMKGETIHLKLDKLETFHLAHDSDLSGTIIVADKAIAVLSGNVCAKLATRFCDLIVDFLLPVDKWGTEFVVAPTGTMDKKAGDIFRVFANENNTRIRSKNGVRLLNSGNFTEFDLQNELSSFFECSKPCQVVQYTKGYVTKRGEHIDPSMIVLPSISHFLNTYKVFLSGDRNDLFRHSITLLIKTSEKKDLLFNGTHLTGLQWQNIEGTKFSWTIFQISSEVVISHSSRKVVFGLLTFGEANYESYGFPGGFSFLLRKTEVASWSRWGSWSECTVSCNSGKQTRRRACEGNLVLNDETRCHGKMSEARTCSKWKCPDCNKVCKAGKLNGACDACICSENVLYGVVKSKTGVLLDNVTIALSEFPFKILARTNISGRFKLKGVCISEDEITASRNGYMSQTIKTTKINSTTATVTAMLEKIVFPEVTSQPESKLRLEGQSMTLCCEGEPKSTPQFEWIINGRAADKYQHDEISSSKLIIPLVTSNMTGEIKCRVYNDYGAEFSNPAKITILNATDDSCNPIPSEQIITLPQGCRNSETNSVTIDVGKCDEKECISRGLKNINNCKDNFCCQPVSKEKIRIKCVRNSFHLTRVKMCGCGDCSAKQSLVKGVARGGPENTPFKYGYIYHGDKYLTYTGAKGHFSFNVPGDLTRFVVTFKDEFEYNNFQEVTKAIPVVPGRETYVEIRMKIRQKPIKVNAAEGFKIPLGAQGTVGVQNYEEAEGETDNEKQSAPAVSLALPPQSLMTKEGEIYNGTAMVEVNFVDPKNATQVEEADGDFTTIDEDGEERLLETFGVIKMDFKDDNGKSLQPIAAVEVLFDLDEYNITEKEAENVKLWYMDKQTGRWRIMDNGLKRHETRRSKRSKRRFYFGKIEDKLYDEVINIDEVGNECFLKVKVDGQDIPTAQLTVLATQRNLFRYKDYSIAPNIADCIEAFCTEELATIKAVVNGEPLVPNDRGIDDDVKRKHAVEFYRSSDAANRFSNRVTVKRLTDPLSSKPSPFYSDFISCYYGPQEYSLFFEDQGYKQVLEEVENFNNGWYENNFEAEVCFVKIAVDNIKSCPNQSASFLVESLIGEEQDVAGSVTITMSESKSTACAEFRCRRKASHDIMVKVVPLANGKITHYDSATQSYFNTSLNCIVSEVFSFKPSTLLNNPDVGILYNKKVFIKFRPNKTKINTECRMNAKTKPAIRFSCKH